MKQDCWPAVSLRVSSEWLGISAEVPAFYSSASDVKSFCVMTGGCLLVTFAPDGATGDDDDNCMRYFTWQQSHC